MKEINKENDILVSTLLNPTADVTDLIANGINGVNTGLLSEDDYKKSKFVQKAFTDQNGVFDNEQFQKAYDLATNKFNELQSIQTYTDLNSYAKYDQNDIYAPLQSNKTSQDYKIQKVKNPLHVSEGVTTLFSKGESDKSLRELAQQHKVWDPENQKWLDHTAEDLGLKYLISPTLVYATWDEDGTHFDKSIGREVQHKKGEWKTDENGEFYTELAGNKQQYGKEYVALSDVLTKEDSWANKLDFFDSDDKEKSLGGQLMKTAATIVPYLIPGVREVWGGITAAVAMGTVLPTFGKMLEGIAVGDKETAFTKAMSAQENFFNKFNSSHSDEAQKSIINSETMLETVGDIFGQLYQMRAAASLSKLFQKSMTKAEKDASKKFAEKFGSEFAKASMTSKDFSNNIDEWKALYNQLLQATPEMKAVVDKTSKLSKSLSLGYMALTSSADVYSDAIQGGYDRRMAGLAGLLATAGQYALMMNNRMGDWFLDATVGYQEGVSRNAIRQALKPYYKQINEATKKLGQPIGADQKVSILSKLYNNIFKQGGKKLVDLIKYGGESVWQRATIEGVEEVTEEAVMDATKGIFDALSYFGIGKNSDTASFGGWSHTFSSEGAQRYLMNFLGGAIGGALFDVQGRYIEPKINAIISGQTPPEVRYSIIDEVMKGHTQQLLEEAEKIASSDKTPIKLENGEMSKSTQGDMIKSALQNYIRFVDGVVTENNFKIGDIMSDETIKKVIRTKALQPIMESSGIMDMITGDYTKMIDDYIKLQAEYNEKYNPNAEDKDNKKEKDNKSSSDEQNGTAEEETKIDSSEKERLERELKNKKQQIIDFLSGKNEEEYLKTALIYLHPALRKAAMGVDKYIFTQGKYGVDYSSLQDTGAGLSKESINKEYAEWKQSSDNLDKMRQIGIEGFNAAEKQFSKVLKDYADTKYSDVRMKVLDSVLADSNFNLENLIKDPDTRNSLIELTKQLENAKLPGIDLEDKLKLGEEAKQKLIDNLVNVNDNYFQKLSNLLNEEVDRQKQQLTPEEQAQVQYYSQDKLKDLFKNALTSNLEKLPLQNYTKQMIDNALAIANSDLSKILVNSVIKQIPGEHTAETIKNAIDTELTSLGFSPIVDYQLQGDTTQSAINYVMTVTSPKFNPGSNNSFTVGHSILDSYIDSNSTIDNEIANRIKQLFIKDTVEVYDDIYNAITSGEFESVYIDSIGDDAGLIQKNENENKSKLQQFVQNGINKGQSIEEIVNDWLFSQDGIIDLESEGFQEFEKRYPNIREKAVKTVSDIIKNIPTYSLFKKVSEKQALKNPLFDALHEIGMKVFDGDDIKLFDFLAEESKILSSANIGDYIRQGFTKEAIDNFISKLEFIQALAVGMEETDLTPEHQIAFNVQMRLWDQKWNSGKNSDKYATIDTQSVLSIRSDLQLLINKLNFIKTLIETNTESKIQENAKTEKNFNNLILDVINNVGQFAIGGVTILPTDDDLQKCKTEQEQVALIEHTLYQKVQQLVKEGQKLEDVVNTIYEKFNINRETIHNENLLSEPLNSDTKLLSDYDIFVWLTTALSSDNYEFLYKYKNLLSQDTYKLVPFFTQEYAVKVLYSFANDSFGVHNEAIKWLYKQSTSQCVQEATQLTFVNGIAGAGKTAAVMATAKALLEEDNIICAAPNENQAVKLAQSLQSVSQSESEIKTFNKRHLLETFVTEEGLKALDAAIEDQNLEKSDIAKIVPSGEDGSVKVVATIDPKYIKSVKDSPKFLFIDEITHFNIAELALLNAAAKKNSFKIITAGDTLQKGNNVWNNYNIQDIFSWKTPALTISSRAANIHQKDNVNLLQATLRYTEAISLREGFSNNNAKVNQALDSRKRLTYYQTDNELQGCKIVNDISVEDLKSIKNAAEGKILMIIADLDNNGEIEDSQFLSKLHDAGITNYTVYSPDDYSSKAVQGAEADYVIIKNMPFPGSDQQGNLRTFYTYLSRALEGALIQEAGYSDNLNLVNEKVPYTSRYELPGLAQQSTIKGEKLQDISSIIGEYKPEEKRVSSKPQSSKPARANKAKTSVTSSTTSEESATAEDSEQLLELTEEAEENMEKTSQPANVISNNDTVDGIRSYSYYNRLGLKETNVTATEGNHLDLDGMLGKSGQRVPSNIILGYKKLKNYLVITDSESLYNNDGTLSESFKEALYDQDIVDLLYAIYPNIVDEDALSSEEIRAYVIDAINNNELTLDFGDQYYIVAKKYDPDFDESSSLTQATTSKKDSIIANFGKQLQIKYNGETIANQIITLGSLGQMDTIINANAKFSHKIKCDGYAKLLADATNKLKTKSVVIYEVESPTIGRDLVIYQPKNGESFISVQDMMEQQGVHFETNEYGIPNVYLINNEKSTINGIESFSFLHLIAQTEQSELDYATRIKQLEDSFVKDGKLTTSGYYFTIASYGVNSDLQRVLILQPSSYSFIDALKRQHSILHSQQSSNQGNKLLAQAESMSQASQMRLFRAVFNALGAVDSNGLMESGTEGIKPYLEKIINDISNSSTNSKMLSNLAVWLSSEIEQWEDKDFDMDFLSYLMRGGTPNEDGKVSSYGRYIGPLLINDLIQINNNGTITAKELLQEGETRRKSVDIDFDFSQLSYREFQAAAEQMHDSFTLSDSVEYTPVKIRLDENNLHFIGLYNTYIQPPYFYFNDDDLGNATIASIDFSTENWERREIKWSGKSETTTKANQQKKEPTTASIKEMRDSKSYNSKIDKNPIKVITYSARGNFKDENGYAYKIDKSFYNIRTFTDKELENWSNKDYQTFANKNNLFNIRLYDTVQIFGDNTHTYKLSYAILSANGQHVIGYKFSHKDGKPVTSNDVIYVNEISSVVGRDIPDTSDYGWKYIIQKDYYSHPNYEYARQDYKAKQTGKAALVWNLNQGTEAVGSVFSNPQIKNVLIYAVHETDDTAISPITNSVEQLEDGMDLTNTGIYIANNVEQSNQIIEQLSQEDNLDGIAIIGVYGSGEAFAEFMQNKKAFLQRISNNGEGYIKAYLSDSKKPKFTQKTAKVKAAEKYKAQKSAAEILKQNLDLIDRAIANKNDKEKLFNQLHQIQYASKEDIEKQFGTKTKYLIYRLINENNQVVYSVFPKQLLKEKKVDFTESPLLEGQDIKILREKDGTYYDAKIKTIGQDEIELSSVINGEQIITKVSKKQFGLLYNIKYLTPEQAELLDEMEKKQGPVVLQEKNNTKVKRKSASTSAKAQEISALLKDASEINDFYERLDKLKEKYYDTFSEAKQDFPTDYFVFPHNVDGETKYSVIPKSIISEFKNVQFDGDWKVGNTLKIIFDDKKKNGEGYEATIKEISDKDLTYEYTIGDRVISKTVPLNEFNMLTNIRYFKEQKQKVEQPTTQQQKRLKYLPTQLINELRSSNKYSDGDLLEFDNIYKELTDYWDRERESYKNLSNEDWLYYIEGIREIQLKDSSKQISDMFETYEKDGEKYMDLIKCE